MHTCVASLLTLGYIQQISTVLKHISSGNGIANLLLLEILATHTNELLAINFECKSVAILVVVNWTDLPSSMATLKSMRCSRTIREDTKAQNTR